MDDEPFSLVQRVQTQVVTDLRKAHEEQRPEEPLPSSLQPHEPNQNGAPKA